MWNPLDPDPTAFLEAPPRWSLGQRSRGHPHACTCSTGPAKPRLGAAPANTAMEGGTACSLSSRGSDACVGSFDPHEVGRRSPPTSSVLHRLESARSWSGRSDSHTPRPMAPLKRRVIDRCHRNGYGDSKHPHARPFSAFPLRPPPCRSAPCSPQFGCALNGHAQPKAPGNHRGRQKGCSRTGCPDPLRGYRKGGRRKHPEQHRLGLDGC